MLHVYTQKQIHPSRQKLRDPISATSAEKECRPAGRTCFRPGKERSLAYLN